MELTEQDCPNVPAHMRIALNAWVAEYDELRQYKIDAQATIAALQARVQELEQWVQDQSTANLETMRHTDEMQSRALEAEQQLTQRTAELEAAQRERGEAAKDRDDWITSWRALQRHNERIEAELERVREERDHAKKMEVVQKEVADNQTWHVQKLRALILALPKVEGEIEIYTGKNTNQVVVTYKRGVIIGTLYGLDHAKPVAALYKHRQGMEGVNES